MATERPRLQKLLSLSGVDEHYLQKFVQCGLRDDQIGQLLASDGLLLKAIFAEDVDSLDKIKCSLTLLMGLSDPLIKEQMTTGGQSAESTTESSVSQTINNLQSEGPVLSIQLSESSGSNQASYQIFSNDPIDGNNFECQLRIEDIIDSLCSGVPTMIWSTVRGQIKAFPSNPTDMVSIYIEYFKIANYETFSKPIYPTQKSEGSRTFMRIVNSIKSFLLLFFSTYLPTGLLDIFLTALTSSKDTKFVAEHKSILKNKIDIAFRNLRAKEKRKAMKGQPVSITGILQCRARAVDPAPQYSSYLLNADNSKKKYTKDESLLHYLMCYPDMANESEFVSKLEFHLKIRNKLSADQTLSDLIMSAENKLFALESKLRENIGSDHAHWQDQQVNTFAKIVKSLELLCHSKVFLKPNAFDGRLIVSKADSEYTSGMLLADPAINTMTVRMSSVFIQSKPIAIEKALFYFFLAHHYYEKKYDFWNQNLMIFIENILFDWSDTAPKTIAMCELINLYKNN